MIRRLIIVAETSGAILYDRIIDPSFNYVSCEKLGSLLLVFHQFARSCNQETVQLVRFSSAGAILPRFGSGFTESLRADLKNSDDYPETFLSVYAESGCLCGVYYSEPVTSPKDIHDLCRLALSELLQRFRDEISPYQAPRKEGDPIAVVGKFLRARFPEVEAKMNAAGLQNGSSDLNAVFS